MKDGLEEDIDCGGDCDPCDPCAGIGCTTNADCAVDHVCNTDPEVDPCGACLPLACSGATDPDLAVGHNANINIAMYEGCADIYVGDQNELDMIHHDDRDLKFSLNGAVSGSCNFTSPNYTYVYTTKYCLSYQGIANKTYAQFLACPVWAYTTGSGRVSGANIEFLIPVEQYTISARISFVNSFNNCVLNSNIYWQ